MTQDQDNTSSSGSTLRRKVSLGEERRATHTMSLARAMRLSLAKLADEQFDLALSVLNVNERELEHGALKDALEESNLLMLLEGTDRARAMMAVDPSLVGAIIQQQTMGKVLAPSGDARPMTETDGALCAPFLNDVLSRAAAYLAQTEELSLIAGFGGAARVENLRLMTLALDAAEFHMVEIELDLAAGACQGKVILALPIGKPQSAETDLNPEAERIENRVCLSDAITPLPLELNVCLSQIRLSYQSLTELEVGQSLPLGKSGLDRCHLQTKSGQTLFDGAVGQIAGDRAFQFKPVPAGQKNAANNSLDTFDALDTSAQIPELDLPDGAAFDPGIDPIQPDPELPTLAEPPGMIDIPDMPDMSDLPELDDLPELPDFAEQKTG